MYEKYNTIETHPYIPQQAFLYLPIGESAKKQQDDYKLILQKGVIKRLIYEGGLAYTQQQNQTINKFYDYLMKKQLILQKQWSRALIYKFLQSTGFDYKKTVKEIQNHTEYQREIRKIDFEQLKSTVQPILKKGIFYFNGRDTKFRPIIVVNVAKINQLQLSEKLINDCLVYFFQFLYRNMFINGQVENVIGVIDIGYTSPFNLIKPMKMTISFLQGNYKYKLHRVYILKATSMFNFAFGVAKNFMKQDTIKKVVVLQNKLTVDPLLQYCNQSQLQRKFGGTHQNFKDDQFWPPKQFSSDYLHPNVKVNIITGVQYKKLYRDGKLVGRKIHKPYIEGDSELQSEIPLLNLRPPTMRRLKKLSSSQKLQKINSQRSLISRFFKKMGCNSCFGADLERR